MYELLIRIETVCVEAPLLTLLGVGAVATVAGLLLWLAGTYFSSVIIGILGAAVGSFCGLLISQWFDISSLLSMGIGAGVFCVAAVLLRNLIIIVLAIIVFALAGGTGYSSFILGSPAQQQEQQVEPELVAVSSFSQMDSTTRLSYVDNISEEQDGFFEKLKVLLKDTFGAMSPYKWKLLLSTVVGGLGGLLLVWLIKRFVIALCCSVVGALLVLVGIEILLMGAGLQMCNAFGSHRLALTVTYFSMVGIGAVTQLMIVRSQKPKEAEAGKK